MKVRRRSKGRAIRRSSIAALFTVILGAGVGLAHSPHVVQPGETLGSIAREHLGSTARWREIARANSLPDPHHIDPGTVLTIPTLETPDVAVHVSGSGEARANDQAPWRPLAANSPIPRSGEVRTDTGGFVAVRTAEGALLQIRGRSAVRFPPAAGGTRNLVLSRGALTAKVDRARRATFQITTPAAVAGVRGTDFLVDYDAEARRNSVSVRDGSVDFTAQGVTVGVAAGYGSSAAEGAPPSPAVPLPPPPALAAPANGAEIGSGSVEFLWRAVPGASAYLLEIGSDPGFSRILISRIVDAASGDSMVGARAGRLGVGTHYWRVAARSAAALEGYPAPARRFSVVDPLVTLRQLYRERQFDVVVGRVNEMDSPGFRHAMLRAWSYYRLGMIDQAESAFRALNGAYPRNDEVLLGLAYCAFRLERNDEAERGFRDVLQLDPASAEAVLGIAHIFYRQERWDEAIDYYERSLALSPGNSEAEEYLADARTRRGR